MRIVVVGSYNVGLTVRVPRLPVLGETLSGRDFSAGPGGKGANQAIAAARLGAQVEFIGAVGKDPYGDGALALFEAENVRCDRVRRIDEHTGVGLIMLREDGQNAIVVALGANLQLTPEDVDAAEEAIAQSDLLITVLEIMPETARRALDIAREHDVLTVLNPAPARPLPKGYLDGIDYLTPNETEARILAGVSPDARVDLGEVGKGLLAQRVGNVVITQGEQGATIVTGDGVAQIGAPRIDAVDATGAGDAFNGALAVALAEKRRIKEAVQWACHAGAFCTMHFEVIPGLARRAQLEQFIATHRKT